MKRIFLLSVIAFTGLFNLTAQTPANVYLRLKLRRSRLSGYITPSELRRQGMLP